MKRFQIYTLVLVPCLAAMWQCQRQPGGGTATQTTATPGPELSVTGPVLFKPTTGDLIYVADFPVTLKGVGPAQTSKTDLLGRYSFSGIAPGKYKVCWERAGWVNGCTTEVEVTAGNSAYPPAVELKPSSSGSAAWGDVSLADGSVAVAIDRGFGLEQVPSVEVLDAAGKSIGAGRTNAMGKYAIGVNGEAATIRLTDEALRQEATVLPEAAAAKRGTSIRLSNHRPVISKIEAVVAGGAAAAAHPGGTVTLRSTVTDADGDHLVYRWSASAGTITGNTDGTATWKLPAFQARLIGTLLVTDGRGGAASGHFTLPVPPEFHGLPNINLLGPPTCNPLSLAKVPPPSGYPTAPVFLTYMLNGANDDSAAYYLNVDPKNLRTTLGAWWKVAGFNASDGSGGVAQAAYLNWNDLGFGRDMHFNQVGNNVYAWVTNYGCPDDDPNNANLAAKPNPPDAVATVCMEYAPVEGQTQGIVKFFVYAGGVAAGTRIGNADLDEWGPKPVPNLCQNCHGGPTKYRGGTNVNLGANFLPFDLALLQYPGPSKTPPPSDLPAYHKMNSIILNSTHPTQAITSMIQGWYTPLNSPPTQNNNYLPAGWQAGASVPASAAGLYQNVIAPGCRACHYSLSTSINWDSYQSAQGDNGTIQAYVCGPQPVMAHAAVTYINFWTNAYGFTSSPPQFLGQYTDKNWPAFGSCTGK
jgi:hypothetical protein